MPDSTTASSMWNWAARPCFARDERTLDAHPKSEISYRCPVLTKGRFAIVTNVGSGMRWTQVAAQTSGAKADGEVVWSWRPDAGVKFAEGIPQATVAKGPVTGESTK